MTQHLNQNVSSITIFCISVIVLALSGCVAAPTRADQPDEFKVLLQGQIRPQSVQAFVDCLLDGFDNSHSILMGITSRQQRRADSYRIETLGGNGSILLVSADAFDNGRIVLNESKSAALIPTSGEQEAFTQCSRKYAP